MILWVIDIIPTRTISYLLFERRKPSEKRESERPEAEPYNVTEYSQRREKYILSLEEERRAEYTIVLWWGYDGLRLNKDDTFEWTSRKPPEPVSGGVFYQPMQGFNSALQSFVIQTPAYPSYLYAGSVQSQPMNCYGGAGSRGSGGAGSGGSGGAGSGGSGGAGCCYVLR